MIRAANFRKIENDEIPDKLLSIPSAPKKLFVAGDLPIGFSIAIVGSREIHPATTEMIRQMLSELAAIDLDLETNIVSGMALGVDLEAHQSALKEGFRTTAIFAHPINQISSHHNQTTISSIIKNDGCLISESESGELRPYMYPRRNRLQSGLADVTVIMQSDIKGGTLHTYHYAALQKRPILVFNPDIKETKFAGNKVILSNDVKVINEQLHQKGYGVDAYQKQFGHTGLEFKTAQEFISIIGELNV